MTDPTPGQSPDPTPVESTESAAFDSERAAPVPSESVQGEYVQVTSVRVRRAPRLASFLVIGLGFGVLLAIIATFAFPPNEDFATTQVFGFLLLFGAVLGAALGAVVALVIGRVLAGRTREVAAERESTRPAPEAP